MACATLMIHLELGRPNDDVLGVARDLAPRLGAAVTGIAACRPLSVAYGDIYVSGDLLAEDRREIATEARAAEAELREALTGRTSALDWVAGSVQGSLVDFLAAQARGADCLLTAHGPGASLLDNSRHIDLGTLVVHAGRPVMIVPDGVKSLPLECAVVAWKDSREARRAALDALPFLKLARRVTVVEIAREADLDEARKRVADVGHWLARHGITASPVVRTAAHDHGSVLADFVRELGADLLVAGAYGRGRFGEAVWGGVTEDYLLRPPLCTLLSH